MDFTASFFHHPDLLRSREALTRISISQKVIIDKLREEASKETLFMSRHNISSSHACHDPSLIPYFCSMLDVDFSNPKWRPCKTFLWLASKCLEKSLTIKGATIKFPLAQDVHNTIMNWTKFCFSSTKAITCGISHKVWGYWAAKNV